MQHTQTPWRVGDAGHTVFGPKRDKPSPEIVAPVTNKANAEFIVKACNEYDKMRELLDRAANMLQDMEAETGSDMNNYLATWTEKLEEMERKHTEVRKLLSRAADTLQDMEAETDSDMNNSLAMEIWAFLEE